MISLAEYTAEVGYGHRKRLAQFFTPPAIARFMVGWVLGGARSDRIHDPAFGLGAFLDCAPADCAFTGMEIDDRVVDFFIRHSRRRPESLACGDYLLDFGRRHANIVCNPPYLRFQKFLNRDAVFAAFCERLGIRLSGYTNIASAFLVKSVSELENGGRLAYILPSEFLNSGYGELVKDWLSKDGHLDSIIEVECENEAFGEVTTSVCIVLYDSARRIDEVAFRKISSLAEIDGVMDIPPLRSVPLSCLDVSGKWGVYFVAAGDRVQPAMRHLCPLSEYGRFSRGIATGANGFFVLSRSGMRRNGLSAQSCVPCITRSQQLAGLTFTDEDFAALAEADKGVFLFSPGEDPDEPSRRYIRQGEEKGYNKGFITRHRSPWYKTEERAVAPILLNVFSRSGYKVVRNYSSALSLTNFHCFYPHRLRDAYVDWLFLYLHSGVGRKLLSLSKRRYGNALDKFEPNDLNDALVPTRAFFDSLGQDVLTELMDAVISGKDPSLRLDEAFAPLVADAEAGDVVPAPVKYPFRRREPEQMRLAIEKRKGYDSRKAGTAKKVRRGE
ncbi:MAG: SAM-dependent DNA methyltransferase [Kiritimatiellae bacterium]|nr:SAM-dependent DNA methyltransferase [Kiritimatiellia bacterium]